MATNQFESFKNTLKKVFMLDQADLDFGIYRIMNNKKDEIERYLNERLKAQVEEILVSGKSLQTIDTERELEKARKNAIELGIRPGDIPKVQELEARLAEVGSARDWENDVYSHLTIFFSRYYDGGDFISQRRYKKDVYAIPYEGEEVKLHWANADQYYIKTGEYFRNYRFRTESGKVVEFTLKEATTEQNNNKVQNNMERRFALYEEKPVEVINGELHINFTYGLYPKTTKQKALITAAYEAVKELIPAEFRSQVLALRPTESDRWRTLLQKHLADYVARNTFDYFIHKDLKGFLSRELDFYIKNEILEIDDID
ncbi:MAG: site-specific DNA-methyltransferase, partial [Prevotella sp.]|nr:site-specific DNA-methyltransferase [Prevotella sp.]